ncbi:hypothetical protein EAF00_010866 [Botryotinia globosa]|nr:hypothetical protein EAF00_010866 [Botryotinia globosa]
MNTTNMERTTMSCFPEYSFDQNSYPDHLHCFESCDHSDRYMSFLDFMEPLHEKQRKIDEEYSDLTREYVRVNRIYARSLNEFIGSSIKFSAPKRRNWLCTDYLSVAPSDSSDLCVCCDCFQELVASYLELVNDIEFQQKYIEIFKVEYWELVDRTIALFWKIDNNQVRADELAAMMDAEDRKDK